MTLKRLETQKNAEDLHEIQMQDMWEKVEKKSKGGMDKKFVYE